MKRKNIYKIGLSLLIALAFLLPTASAIQAPVEKAKAGESTRVLTQYTTNGLSAQAAGDVSILAMTEPELAGPDGHSIVGGCYDITATIYNEPGMGPALVKTFVDIYHKTSGIDVVMYETSFEDNFDIYNNWIQIDADCGVVGGQFDSWAWTDARAFCDDHSMKNTMYDVYKGNQDDYLQCTKSFDISKQDAINISFMAWVQGDYENYVITRAITAYDYLDFEIGDNTSNNVGGRPWFNPQGNDMSLWTYMFFDRMSGQTTPYLLPGDYYFFDTTWDLYNRRYKFDYTTMANDMGDGWWLIWYEIPTATLAQWGYNIYDIMFRFSWHSDPEFQYEGAYVDCVKVVSVEHMEEKVFQSHSQGEFLVPEGCTNYTFPMQWCVEPSADKDDTYDIKLWLEVIDDTHTSKNDWAASNDVYVHVTEWFDVEVDCLQIESSYFPGIILDTCSTDPDVPTDDVRMDYGDDAHIIATIHADGTLPAADIPVTASAYPKAWEDILFTDFEGMQPFTDMAGEAHITSADAWSGEKSLGFFDEDFMRYTDTYDFSFGYALAAQTIDFEGDAPVYLDFYWKGLTETNSDNMYICCTDLKDNIVLSNYDLTLTGYQPDWIGTMQPSCRYERYDLRQIYDYGVSIGYYRDSFGNIVTETGFGWLWLTNYNGINYNAQALAEGYMWSGIYIDDVRIYTEKVGDTPVWTQTIMIPELEPCETQEVQFEWENLPYSNYKIVIEANPTGACGNLEDNTESAQIHVYSNLERASDKEMETYDYTAINNGAFGISSSDYDNYIASNAEFHTYETPWNMVLQLCIGEAPDEKCFVSPGGPLYFDAWYELYGGWDYLYFEWAPCATEDDPTTWDDWTTLSVYRQATGLPLYPYGAIGLITGYSALATYGGNSDGWFTQAENNGLFVNLPAGPIQLRMHFETTSGLGMRGIKLDDFYMPNLIIDDVAFLDTCDNLDNWCPQGPWSLGTFWVYDEVNDKWCWNGPTGSPELYNDAIIWSTEIMDAYMAEFCFYYNNSLTSGQVVVDISADGGLTWFKICEFTDTYRQGQGMYCYDLTPFVGQQVLVRFTAQGVSILDIFDTSDYGDTYNEYNVEGLFCFWDLTIGGKKDTQAPITTATMSGTMKESGWYTTPVKVVITAVDQGGAGMGEIHYILDGTEKVVAGNKAEFTVSGNGEHTIEYWGVDAVGNAEVHHALPTFRIDSGAKPTVSITAPTPGIYFNGKKLLSSSNIIIIGGFTAEATATDADSGIYRVTFYLDGNVVADDTTAPFSAYICSKHTGAATLKVVAEDFAQNTAEAEITLKYFKFF